ncbi:MAG: tRNA (adenosine(37)-N6)-dimethylallyltransferase MiaA [Epsilonproteobacteria bacterium]|nr:tRNA (adenosine(37)-N6)-dimethylallyltransferase MiaA [Campylobacterota bacterium]
MKKNKIVVIYGQTASGKSDLAIKIAKRFSGEIISADSVQIYKGFDIGSAKIPKNKRTVIHHMLDVKEPDQEYSAAEFAKEALKIIDKILNRKNLPIVVGGTNFYIRALINGIDGAIKIPCWINQFVKTAYREKKDKLYRIVRLCDPQRAEELSSNDTYRLEKALSVYLTCGKSIKTFEKTAPPVFSPIKIGILIDKKALKDGITERVRQMFSSGLLDETRTIIKKYGTDIKPLYSIGYRQALSVINGTLSISEAMEETIKESLQYAKRQATWLKKEKNILFFNTQDNKLFDYIENSLKGE